MTKVPCVCINSKNKPNIIPLNMWINEGTEYTINHVYYHKEQGIQGVLLDEVQLKGCDPYGTYALTRFAFDVKNIYLLIQLMSECTELNKVDINKLLQESEIQLITNDEN